MSTRLSLEQILREKQTRDLDSITSLSLTHKALSDVSCLSDFKNLEKLNLDFNNLTSLEGLNSCLNLKWLSVKQNKLVSLKGIEGLTKLTVLNAGKNKLKSMDEVKPLVNLCALILNDNQIVSITGLDHMKDLNTLVLSRNPVRKFGESLAKLKSITKISLSNCQLEAIDPSIKGCVELKELRLAHNDIRALPDELVHNQKLQNLDVGNNVITRWSDLKVVSSLHNLKNLNIHGNPAAEKDKVVRKIIKMVSGLQIFNAKPIDKFTKNEKCGGEKLVDPVGSAARDHNDVQKERKKGRDHSGETEPIEDRKTAGIEDVNVGKHSSQAKVDKALKDRGGNQEDDHGSKKKSKKKFNDDERDPDIHVEEGYRQDIMEEKQSEVGKGRSDGSVSAGVDEKKKKKTKENVEKGVSVREAREGFTDRKSKSKRVLADLDVIDDGETPFAELLSSADFDNVKNDGEERRDGTGTAVRDLDAFSGLVTHPTKKKKTNSKRINSSALASLSTEAPVGLGGPSAWGDD